MKIKGKKGFCNNEITHILSYVINLKFRQVKMGYGR